MDARQTVARILGCAPDEIVFTGSGTESDNIAIRGVAFNARRQGLGNHLITTSIEHHAVGHTMAQLRDLFGFEVTFLPVDGTGRVDPTDVANAIRSDTVLVSVMLANNEVGTIEPLPGIGRICHEHEVLLHTDAVQAGGRLPLDVNALSVDLLTLSAHKFYGPKGTGLLYCHRDLTLVPSTTGGGHERGRRPGTVDVAGAVGLATALQVAEDRRDEECARLQKLRDRLIEGVLGTIPRSRLTGHPTERLCHHASFAFEGIEGESLVVNLDLKGIAASAGAACEEGEPEPSHVLNGMGIDPKWGIGSLRLSLGRSNTEEDVNRVLEVLPALVDQLRTDR
jgi:cysteine desulfurase